MPKAGRLVLAVAALVTILRAPPEARAEDVESLIKKGTELRRVHRDREALAEFRKAAAIEETPRVLAQIALAEQALGIWVDAEAHLKKGLAAESDAWIRKNAGVLRGALAVIQRHLATIEVWGGPDGAEVLLDGRSVGRLPSVEPVRVATEEVALEVRSPGFLTVERTLHVTLGDFLRERVELRPLPASAAPAPPPPAAPPAAPAPPAPAPPAVVPSAQDTGSQASAAAPEVARATPAPARAPARMLALEAAVGPRLVSRSLSWNQDANDLSNVTQGGEPAIGAQLAWYPGAHLTSRWPAMLGLAGSADYAPGTVVASRDGRFKTSDSDYWGGLRARVPFGVGDAAATLAFGRQAALLEGTDGSNRAMLSAPDVRYSYLRAGADVQLNVPGGLGIRAGAAYRSVSGAGSEPSDAQSAMFFPRLTVTGLDASAAVAYRFLGVLEGRLGFDVRRYRLDTHAMLGDRLPVSGALDQYLSFWLSLAVLVDGVADGF